MLRKVTFKGEPVTLIGRDIKVGEPAPDFKAVSVDSKEIGLSDFKEKIKVINSFLSLDTPVCDMQVKEFNKDAGAFSPDVAVLSISKDLPFAQKRFCEANNINKTIALSDYKFSSFGINYGLLVKEMNLLGRGVLIIDKGGVLRYGQIVKELSSAPDYEDVLRNLEEIMKNPVSTAAKEELPFKCKPCETGASALTHDTVEKLLAGHRGWQLIEDRKITKDFKFKDFVEAKYFLDLVSVIAEEQGHHPSFTLVYNKLKIALTTHAAGGLTENDFIMARIIDGLGGW